MMSRLQWLLGRVFGRILDLVFRRRWHRPLRRIGTSYGGWHCDPMFLQPGAAVICAGAGEDISFDVGLNRTYGAYVTCIDPTPRAVAHVRRVLDCAEAGLEARIDDGDAVYQLQGFNAARFRLCPVALWDQESTIRLFAPSDASHVSHSVLNLQHTQAYIDVPARRIGSIVKEQGIQRLALVKLDIEGAEYAVIDDMLASGIRPDQLLVEFDELHQLASLRSVWRVITRIRALRRCGYRLVHVEHANFVFVFANDSQRN